MLVDYSHRRCRDVLVFLNGSLLDNSNLVFADDGIDEETGKTVCTGCVCYYVTDRTGELVVRNGRIIEQRKYGNVSIRFLEPAPLLYHDFARKYIENLTARTDRFLNALLKGS